VTVTFTEDGIAALARIAAEVNRSVENIGARRLYTVMERVFEELSFHAPDRSGEKVTVDAALSKPSRRPVPVGRYLALRPVPSFHTGANIPAGGNQPGSQAHRPGRSAPPTPLPLRGEEAVGAPAKSNS
jgi:hypothetical protein